MKKFKLDKKSKNVTNFLVPENYFNDFSKKINIQLPEEERNVISFQSNKFKVAIAVAVAAVVLVGLLIPLYNTFYSSTSLNIDATTIEHHLTYQSEIDSYELISELDESDMNQLQSNFQVHNETIETILAKDPALETLITDY